MRRLLVIAVALAASLLTACGGEIEVPEEDTTAHRGAVLFNERCSGCHSLDANFNVRQVSRDDALFAIRNGGFSGAIMPANIVVGEDAEAVADFLAEYSGGESGGSDPTASGQTGE